MNGQLQYMNSRTPLPRLVPGVGGPRSSSSLTDIHTHLATEELPARHPAEHTDTDSKVGLPPSSPAQNSWEPAMLSRSSTLGRRQSECETVCFSCGLANGCCPPVPLPINTHGEREREDRGGGSWMCTALSPSLPSGASILLIRGLNLVISAGQN